MTRADTGRRGAEDIASKLNSLIESLSLNRVIRITRVFLYPGLVFAYVIVVTGEAGRAGLAYTANDAQIYDFPTIHYLSALLFNR